MEKYGHGVIKNIVFVKLNCKKWLTNGFLSDIISVFYIHAVFFLVFNQGLALQFAKKRERAAGIETNFIKIH